VKMPSALPWSTPCGFHAVMRGYRTAAEGKEMSVSTSRQPAPNDGERPTPEPDSVDFDPDTVTAVGKASEALEWVERARGHLYDFHQMMGHADFLFGDAADMLRDAGHPEAAARFDDDVVGRNVLDGRWTFQVVEEFDDLYYRVVSDTVRRLERELTDGRRHVYESWIKEQRRTRGREGHESRPPSAHSPMVDTEEGSMRRSPAADPG
jgi:hypothetical protein